MTSYRCAHPACQHGIIWQRIGVCPRCGNRLEPDPPRLLARPATTSDQLAIDEELEPWDAYMRRLAAEGGQAQ